MMSLVNYGSSDESDDEDNSSNDVCTSQQNHLKNPTKDEDNSHDGEDRKRNLAGISNTISNKSNLNGRKEEKDEDDILSRLPPPISDLRSIPWDQLSKLTYKSQAIRIMAPVLPEEIEEKKERKLPSKTGSGLLAMLPKPKNEFFAQPKQLKQKNNVVSPALPKPKVLPKPKMASLKPSFVENHASDSDEETEGNVDFFSFSTLDQPVEYSSETINENKIVPLNDIVMPEEPYQNKQASTHYIDTSPESTMEVTDSSSHDHILFDNSNDQLELDNEALAALCGSRGLKRKASKDAFRVIDISGSELTPDAQEVLTKNLTGDQHRPQKKNKDGPTSQQKRKHQIIYLAHQAKEQELELQNTWANNRMTKKQTQAKYGF